MEKNEGSPEKSPSEEDLRRERPPLPPSSEGGESENLPVRGQESRPPVETSPPPGPPPMRFRFVAERDSSGKVVMMEPFTGNTRSGAARWPAGLSPSWTVTVPENKRKGQFGELPIRAPRCVTCGKIYWSWKALFGHLRAHPGRDYRGAFPPPTATVVSAVLDPAGDNSSEGSGGAGPPSGGREPVAQLNTPDENSGALRNNRVRLDLNAPPPSDSDSDDEIVILTE